MGTEDSDGSGAPPPVPEALIGRDREWAALTEAVTSGQRLTMVYGPRHGGTSFLLDHLAASLGGVVHRCAPGTPHVQLRAMAELLGLDPATHPLGSWMAALDRLRRHSAPFVVLDDLPHLLATPTDLPEALARYAELHTGPVLVLAGTSQAAMLRLMASGSPLFGKVSMAISPSPLEPLDLARLWGLERPMAALWVDAVVGSLPGYRPLVEPPGSKGTGEKVASWMKHTVLAHGSPLLDAAEVSLAEIANSQDAVVVRSVLDAVARGAASPELVALEVGLQLDDAAAALHALERSATLVRVRDPLRERRDIYELADPHLRFWLTVVAPNRAELAAGRAAEVWRYVRDSLWRAGILGRRWESVVRRHVVRGRVDGIDGVVTVGASAGLDLVAVDASRRVVAIGRTAVDALGLDELRVLEKRREDLGVPEARLVLASTVRVHAAAVAAGAVAVVPRDVYGGPPEPEHEAQGDPPGAGNWAGQWA